MQQIPRFKLKAGDILLIGLLLLAGVAGLWSNIALNDAGAQRYAVVYVDNRKVAELSLDQGDRFTYTFAFGEDGRHTAHLEVEDGRVRMLPISEELCPKGVCSHTGWITRSYESIVCLPNRILVVFDQAPAGEQDLDGITK